MNNDKISKLIGIVLSIALFIMAGCEKEYAYLDMKDNVDFGFPIDNPEEAIAYSINLQEFTSLRNNFKDTTDWTITSEYRTEKEHKKLFEGWYKSGKIAKEEYEERIRWSETQGDYWHVNWQSGGAFCMVEFRSKGELKNIAGMGQDGTPFYCGYLMK